MMRGAPAQCLHAKWSATHPKESERFEALSGCAARRALTTARVLEVLAAAFLAMIGISLLIGTLVHDGKGLG